MRKRDIALVLGIGAAVSYILKDKENRNGLMDKLKAITIRPNTNNQNEASVLEQAGVPDQLENDEELSQLENAKMVSEGSQYGVQYYNKVFDEE